MGEFVFELFLDLGELLDGEGGDVHCWGLGMLACEALEGEGMVGKEGG